jgi:hypothetical protein
VSFNGFICTSRTGTELLGFRARILNLSSTARHDLVQIRIARAESPYSCLRTGPRPKHKTPARVTDRGFYCFTAHNGHRSPCALRELIGRLPTLPHTCACSTIGAERLNFRVRDGNGWDPLAEITRKWIEAP